MKVIIGGDVASTFRGEQAFINEDVFSEDVIGLFRSADYSIVNLESPIKGVSSKKDKCGQALEICPNTIAYLNKCGINAVTLANNHFKDQGELGVVNTVKALQTEGIEYVGGGANSKDISKFLKIKDSIGIFNYCESEFSVSETCGSNSIDPIKIFNDIQMAKKSVKYVIVIIHGGREKYNLPTPRMQKLYRYIIDVGANLVINHHQHCYSGYECYNGSMIFYGLGNLFFDKGGSSKFQSYGYNEGFLLELDISEYNLQKYILHPYTQGLKEQIPVTFMGKKEKEIFFHIVDQLNSIIADNKSLIQHNEEWCKSHEREILVNFEPFKNRYIKALYRRGYVPSLLSRSQKLILLNMLRCETHNEQCITALINVLKLR